MGEAGILLLDLVTPWDDVRDAGAPLVWHDSLCPMTPPGLPRRVRTPCGRRGRGRGRRAAGHRHGQGRRGARRRHAGGAGPTTATGSGGSPPRSCCRRRSSPGSTTGRTRTWSRRWPAYARSRAGGVRRGAVVGRGGCARPTTCVRARGPDPSVSRAGLSAAEHGLRDHEVVGDGELEVAGVGLDRDDGHLAVGRQAAGRVGRLEAVRPRGPVRGEQVGRAERLRRLDPDQPLGQRGPVEVDQVVERRDRDRATVLGGRGQHALVEVPARERPGGVVHRDHVDLAGLDVVGQQGERPPLRGVPGLAAGHHRHLGCRVRPTEVSGGRGTARRRRAPPPARRRAPRAPPGVRRARPAPSAPSGRRPGRPPSGSSTLLTSAPTRVPAPAARTTTAARISGPGRWRSRRCPRRARSGRARPWSSRTATPARRSRPRSTAVASSRRGPSRGRLPMTCTATFPIS